MGSCPPRSPASTSAWCSSTDARAPSPTTWPRSWRTPDMAAEPKWREQYPVDVERDHYVTRRGFATLLTLGSALAVAANAIIAAVGQWLRRPARTGEGVFVTKASSVATGASILFRYP